MKKLGGFVILLWLVACAPFVDVAYDDKISFSDYTTYGFYPDIVTGLDSLEQKIMMESIDEILLQKDMWQSETPKLFVNFYVVEEEKVYENLGAYYYDSSVIVQNITLDFVDVEKDRLIWQAEMQRELPLRLDSGSLQKYYDTTAERLLAQYPPE